MGDPFKSEPSDGVRAEALPANLGGGAPVSPPPPLAIVGIGCMFPKADCTEAFWANIKGADAMMPASHWKAEDYFDGDLVAGHDVCEAWAFLRRLISNPLEFGMWPNNLEAIDTTQLLGMWW